MASRLQPKVFLAGRVAVQTDGVVVDEGGFSGRQGRLLFAYLVAEQGRPVPRDELAEALWGETPPPSWDKALTGIVSKLRGLLADQGIDAAKALTGAFGCYRLELPEGTWVDVVAAANAAEEAEEALAASDFETARDAASLAASLLRAPFLPGEEGRWVEEKRGELADVRERALNALADALLRSGDAPEAVRWAEQAIALAPFRESGYRRLMEAHVAAGDRAEALRVYERCRRFLAEELGAYPSPETESIYRRILEAPPPAAAGSVEPRTAGAPPLAAREHSADNTPEPIASVRTRRRRLLVGLAFAATAIAAGTVAAVTLLPREGRGAPTGVSANAVAIFGADGERPTGEIPVGQSPGALAAGGGSIWVANVDAHTVSRVDPVKRVVIQTIQVGNGPAGIAFGGGALWVANGLDGTVSRIDPKTNTVVETSKVGNGPVGVIYAAGAVWVANTGDGTITRIDAESGKPSSPWPVGATEFAFGDGSLWASQEGANQVVRIDTASGDVSQAIHIGNGPTGIAFGQGSVWVANSLDGTVSRIDPVTNSVTNTIQVGNGPTAIGVDKHGVWVSNRFGGTLVRIDPRTSMPGTPIKIGNRPQGVTATDGELLVSVDAQPGARHRGGTLTVRNDRPIDSIDNALTNDSTAGLLLGMTGDGLVAFEQASGLAGTQLVPDLAVSLPAPTDGGKRYTFRLRSGIRYSNGEALRASDVRATIERDFKVGSPATYYDGIVGGTACRKHPKRCNLSQGIVPNDGTGVVTFHLVAPDPEFLYKLALHFANVLPAGTPARAAGTHSLPATGPYMIASYHSGHVLRLVRNPYFHEWSKAAQPDGYPDKIVDRIGGKADEAIRDVIGGKADLVSTSWSGTPSESLLAAIKIRHASQVHTNPAANTWGLFLNTRVAPFDRLDVRRAVNYAADRAAALNVEGGEDLAQTTCQILPPNLPGHRPYCPYTAGSTGQSSWTAPDLAKARTLVARSGTRGSKITVWDYAPVKGFGPYAVRLLRSLGYRASLKVLGDTYWSTVADSRTKAQTGLVAWGSDYPASSAFLSPILSCASFLPGNPNNQNLAQFCDPRIDSKIKEALGAQSTNPEAARELWERSDRQIVDEAPWVPLVNLKVVDILSKRVGNYQYGPNGLLIDQLWVR